MAEEESGIPLKLITCPVCLDIFSEPRALPCLHTYCTRCLKGLLRQRGGSALSCPECRTQHPVQGGDVTSFQINFLSNSLIDQHDLEKKKLLSLALKPPPVASSAEDLPAPLTLPITPTLSQCPAHNLPVRWYCRKCETVTCDECICTCPHPEQSSRIPLGQALRERTALLRRLAEKAKVTESSLREASLSEEEVDELLHGLLADVERSIQESFQRLFVSLKSRETDLLQQLRERLAAEKDLGLQQSHAMLDVAQAVHLQQTKLEECMAASQEPGQELRVLSFRPETLESLLEDQPRVHSLAGSVQSIRFSVREETLSRLQEELGALGHVTSGVHPPNCYLQGLPVTQHLQCGQSYHWQLVCLNATQEPCHNLHAVSPQVAVRFVSQSGSTLSPATVRKGGGNAFFITLTAPLAGMYEVHVTIRGEHVGNSPFSVVVEEAPLSSPTPVTPFGDRSLGRQVQPPTVVKSITDPGKQTRFSDVAVTAGGNVVVSDVANDRVCVFNSAGRKLLEFGSRGKEEGQFSEPRCVAVDAAEAIYVTDYNNHRVQKFNSRGQHSLTFVTPRKGDPLKYPSGIALSCDGGSVFVTEQYGCRILVYATQNRECVRILAMPIGDSPRHMKSATYIAVGPNNLLYIADKMLHCVHVVSEDGGYVCRLAEEGHASRRMKRPFGIAVHAASKTLLVSESDGHCVTMVPPRTAPFPFGQHGTAELEFNNPQGIFLDEERCLLYVADQQNKRIVVLKVTL